MELFFVSYKIKTFLSDRCFFLKASLETAVFTGGIFPDV
jgi:hypothetical protein